eukprot:CAMPEP_0119039978 /NCGR_PEP_ID=MMETSP1177-20130426/9755_1 /TAXON_ID=2985 /ORGANISM="Ochromonas sp, Strain CCMP1899" /LENGTH=538 /DNA_ID=CAMNT_0007004559 /DNA_START=782 /DNA_END=2399 /DNA_ORIENTATION=+
MLGYLDRPVDEQERYIAAAFLTGGVEGEAAARESWREEQHRKRLAEAEAGKVYREEQRKEREEKRRVAVEEREKRLAAIAAGEISDDEEESETVSSENNNQASPIRAMSAGEMEAYHTSAAKVTSDEKRIKEIGMDKVAARYWKIENNEELRKKGIDPLDEATRQILAENDQLLQVEKGFLTVGGDKEVVEKVEKEGEKEVVEEVEEVQSEGVKAQMNDVNEEVLDADVLIQTALSALSVSGPSEEDLERERALEEKERDRISALATEKAEKLVREQRVVESVIMYKQQLKKEEIEKNMKNESLNIISNNERNNNDIVNSDEVNVNDDGVTAKSPVVLYWSEDMDIQLAKEVRSCMFDFDVISQRLTDAALRGELGHSGDRAVMALKADSSPTLLLPEACRIRWSDLDAEQWSEISPQSSALDTVFRVCVEKSDLKNGQQLDYQSLSSKVGGCMPKYLTVPSAFPSMIDDEDENEDGDDDGNDDKDKQEEIDDEDDNDDDIRRREIDDDKDEEDDGDDKEERGVEEGKGGGEGLEDEE